MDEVSCPQSGQHLSGAADLSPRTNRVLHIVCGRSLLFLADAVQGRKHVATFTSSRLRKGSRALSLEEPWATRWEARVRGLPEGFVLPDVEKLVVAVVVVGRC